MKRSNLGKLAAIAALAALFLASISVGFAREPGDPDERDGYIYPHLAADGVTSDATGREKTASS